MRWKISETVNEKHKVSAFAIVDDEGVSERVSLYIKNIKAWKCFRAHDDGGKKRENNRREKCMLCEHEEIKSGEAISISLPPFIKGETT
jgi:hypothetical protein